MDRLPALVGAGESAGARDAARALGEVAAALPPLPIEVVEALDAMRDVGKAAAAIRELVPPESRRAFQEQAETMRRVMNSPAIRALQRDRALWARLVEQADIVRRASG